MGTHYLGNPPEGIKQNSGLNEEYALLLHRQNIPMASLLKNVVVFTVVLGSLSLFAQPANAIEADPEGLLVSGNLVTVNRNVARVPEPGAIAPLTLLGAALIFYRKSTHSDAA